MHTACVDTLECILTSVCSAAHRHAQPCKMKIMFIDGACVWMRQAETFCPLRSLPLCLATGCREPSFYTDAHTRYICVTRVRGECTLTQTQICWWFELDLVSVTLTGVCPMRSSVLPIHDLVAAASLIGHFDKTWFLSHFANFNSRHTRH